MDQQQPWGAQQPGPYPPQQPSGPYPPQPSSGAGAYPGQPQPGPYPPQQGAGGYPPQPAAGGYSPQPAAPAAGGGAIAVTTKYHWMAFMMGLFKPDIELNGHPAAKGWGRQVIPVPAGQYHLHVHVPYWLPPRLGSADLPVVVHPGQTVELEYLAPLIVFLGGALGVPPQKYPGMTAQLILLAFVVGMLLCVGGLLLFTLLAVGSTSP